MADKTFLKQSFNNMGIDLTDNQADQFIQFYEMLIEKNKFMNLTAITDYNDVVIKHFVDSLSCVLLDDIDIVNSFKSGCRVIDVGTGAGFPGIPLKIIYPEIRLTLLDSLNKRVLFLNDVCSSLGFTDINVIHSRAEDAAHDNHLRSTFDYSVSRAVANLSTLTEYCLPFVKKDGIFIAYKSEKADEEVKSASYAISLLGGTIESIKKFDLPDTDISRTLIAIKCNKNISNHYPRKAGTPSKDPL